MKHIYFTFFLLFSLTSFSQDEILGRWYLNYTNVQGTITYNAEFGNNHANIEFTENPTDNGFEYFGFVCNSYNGSYINNNDNTISKTEFMATFVFCDNSSDALEVPYFVNTLGYDPVTLNYEVTGTGIDETLVLTNADNGNFAVFGRTAFNEDLLGNWFLQYRVVEGVQQYNNLVAPEIIPSINFTQNSANPFEGLTFDGNGACNNFFGAYTIINSEVFEFSYFAQTLASCTTVEGVNFNDPSYFYDILYSGTGSLSQLHYEITGPINDQILTLTNLSNNNVAVYGRQTLLTTDLAFNKSTIKLKENPVKDQLEIVVENSTFNQISYTIYSIDGKIISKVAILENNKVSLNNLSPGLYFIKMLTDDIQTQTLKFIKE